MIDSNNQCDGTINLIHACIGWDFVDSTNNSTMEGSMSNESINNVNNVNNNNNNTNNNSNNIMHPLIIQTPFDLFVQVLFFVFCVCVCSVCATVCCV